LEGMRSAQILARPLLAVSVRNADCHLDLPAKSTRMALHESFHATILL